MTCPFGIPSCEVCNFVIYELLRSQIQRKYHPVQHADIYLNAFRLGSQIPQSLDGPYHDSNLSLAAIVRDFELSLEDVLRMCPCKLMLTEKRFPFP